MIHCLYGKYFNKRLVVSFDGELYTLELYVHDNQWCPIVIQMLTDSEHMFLDYVKKELQQRRIDKSAFVEVFLSEDVNFPKKVVPILPEDNQEKIYKGDGSKESPYANHCIELMNGILTFKECSHVIVTTTPD